MAGHTAVTLQVIETEATIEATTELPNMPLDSKVIENEAPKE